MRFIYSLLLLVVFVSIPVAGHALASTIILETGDKEVGTINTFDVDVFLSSRTPINALSLVFTASNSLEIIDSSDGNSLISLWVERPHATGTKKYTFSGLIPGGFTGDNGKLLSLKVQARGSGTGTISLAPESIAYTNSEAAATDKVEAKPLSVTIVSGKENVSSVPEDTIPPESFRPQIVSTSDSEEEPAWAVAFSTVDKGSGVRSYEVSESGKKIAVDDKEKLRSLTWKEAESPALLEDQSLSSYIYVKAIDKDKNERVEVISPSRPWYKRPVGYILIAAILLLGCYVVAKRTIKRRTPQF